MRSYRPRSKIGNRSSQSETLYSTCLHICTFVSSRYNTCYRRYRRFFCTSRQEHERHVTIANGGVQEDFCNAKYVFSIDGICRLLFYESANLSSYGAKHLFEVSRNFHCSFATITFRVPKLDIFESRI